MVTQQQRAQMTAALAQAIELGLTVVGKVQGASLEETSIDVRQVLVNELNNEINNRGEC